MHSLLNTAFISWENTFNVELREKVNGKDIKFYDTTLVQVLHVILVVCLPYLNMVLAVFFLGLSHASYCIQSFISKSMESDW